MSTHLHQNQELANEHEERPHDTVTLVENLWEH